FSLDFIWGYRYVGIDENLLISSNTTLTLPTIFVPQFTAGPFGTVTQTGSVAVPLAVRVGGTLVFNPAVVSVKDQFTVSNQFNGNYGTNRPIVPLNIFGQDDYWIQGINFGFQLRY